MSFPPVYKNWKKLNDKERGDVILHLLGAFFMAFTLYVLFITML